jgi:phosphoserine aminotransferase
MEKRRVLILSTSAGTGHVRAAQALEKEFAKQATAAGLIGTPGHRSVGGMRISLYNAVELDAVQALVGFMREFQRARG